MAAAAAAEVKLVTSLIEERLAGLGISLAPVSQEKTAPDVMMLVRKEEAEQGAEEVKVVRVLAHSGVLRRECDFFREWFASYQQQQRQREAQEAEVAGMVEQLLCRSRQQGEDWLTVSNMVQGVMENVRLANPDEDDDDDEAAPPPPPPPKDDHSSDHQQPPPQPQPQQEAVEEEGSSKLVTVEMLQWSLPVAVAILEWIYTRRAHIDVVQLWRVYEAADRMLFTSLAGAIRDYDEVRYYRHAIASREHRAALLRLSSCPPPHPHLAGLRLLCRTLEACPNVFTLVLHAAAVPYRHHRQLLPEGLFAIKQHPLCCLRDRRGSSEEPLRHYLTLERGPGVGGGGGGGSTAPPPARVNVTRGAAWRVLDFGGDPAACCHAVFHYAADTSGRAAREAGKLVKAVVRESFSLRMVTGSMASALLCTALARADPARRLRVTQERGSGYYIRGPSYCFSLLLQGAPEDILVGARAIPASMAAHRAALRIRSPSLHTFRRFLPALASFGVDLEARTLYLIKPLTAIASILELAAGINDAAMQPLHLERHLVELDEPVDPF